MGNLSKPFFVPVVLSGGMGKRLWPLSRETYPKQFLNLSSEKYSLIQETVMRVADRDIFTAPLMVCNEKHRFLVAEKLQDIDVEDATILLEPEARNTAPALAMAAAYIQREYGDEAVMLVLPSDHIIEDTAAFIAGAKQAFETARAGYLTTFGITPAYAETGYGYIRQGDAVNDSAYRVAEFVEKPNAATAEAYLASGDYAWNSGMFAFPVGVFLQEVAKLQPKVSSLLAPLMHGLVEEQDFSRMDADIFLRMPEDSIDYAIMEKTDKAAIVPMDCGWTDAGSWDALWRLKDKDADGNVVRGSAIQHSSNDCYIWSEDGPTVTTLGVKDLVVISTKDCVMIADKNNAQNVKALVEKVGNVEPKLVKEYRQMYRPWGHYDSIDNGDRHQVKRITVNPGGTLSLQSHKHRSEHWVVVSGKANVLLGEKQKILTENESVYIPAGMKHRLINPSRKPLVLIEVQSGDYLGEDDIIRYEDTYGRMVQVV